MTDSLLFKSLLAIVQNLNLDEITALKQEVDNHLEYKKLEWVYSMIPSITSVFDVEISIENPFFKELVIKSKEGLLIKFKRSYHSDHNCYCMYYNYNDGRYFCTWEMKYYSGDYMDRRRSVKEQLRTCPLGVTMEMIEELNCIKNNFTFH